MATINEALKKLFLGLGGDPDELKDNNTVSDYIDDLESAIETAASGASEKLIDDEEASSTKTYSSTKIESLIPENELPTPEAADIGKVVSVISDGESGAEYALETPSGGLPAITSSDKGSILQVSNEGAAGWVKPIDVAIEYSSGAISFKLGYTRQTLYQAAYGNKSPRLQAYIFDMDAQDYSMLNGNIEFCSCDAGSSCVIFRGTLIKSGTTNLVDVILVIGNEASKDAFYKIPISTT